MDRFVDRETELDQLTDCYEPGESDFVVSTGDVRLGKNELVRRFRAVGQWWFKEHELDVLDLTDEGLVAGECKFTSAPVSEGVLSDLERTAAEVRWSDMPPNSETQYVLFSRSGYTDDLKRTADTRDDVRLFEITDLISEG